MARYANRSVYIRAETNDKLKKLEGVGFSALVNDLLLFYCTHKELMDCQIKDWKEGKTT